MVSKIGLRLLMVGAFVVLVGDRVGAQVPWLYSYEGNDAAPGTGGFTALDGTWNHDNGSDEWDGSVIGAGNPGGAMSIDGYLRMQETGDPRDFGMGDPGSNRKIGLGHDLTAQGVSNTILDDGVTIQFRARVPTSGPLDDIRPDGGGNVQPYPAAGDGYVTHDGGKGNFGVKQLAGGLVTFSLATENEGLGAAGLVMNDLNGTAITADVDQQDNDGGTLNMLPIDTTEWHDYFITIQSGGAGTHQVAVYVDGATEPTASFDVTAGSGNDLTGFSYLWMDVGATPQSGALDVDYFRVAAGVHAPVGAQVPAASTTGLALLAVLLAGAATLVLRRRRSWAPAS